MARKWSNLPGALHYVTGNFLDRTPVFTDIDCCNVFLNELQKLNRNWPCKLITYVLMPDHLHLIANPRDGRIKEYTGHLKAVSAKAIVRTNSRFVFAEMAIGHQVWQESFKDLPLWSGWMIAEDNYIHANPVKAGFVRSAKDYTGPAFGLSLTGDEPLAVVMTGGGLKDPEKSQRQ